MPSQAKPSAPARHEVEQALDRISRSRAFAGSPRLVRFLSYVVGKRLDGKAGEIHEYAIGVDVYERGERFDPKIDAIVRVEARRLRKALDSYYRNEGAGDGIVIRVPKGGYSPTLEMRAPDQRWRMAATAAAAALVLLLIGAWAMRRPPHKVTAPEKVERTLLQITSDPGLSAWPDITADGNMIVYSSDRDGGPDLDLWLRYVDRQETVRLTDEPGDEIEAKFSPDGSLVVYTSLPSGSIHTIPTLGGRPRSVTNKGKFPRFTPDGRAVAFSQGRNGWTNNLVVLDLDTGRRRVYGESMRWLGTGVLFLPDGTMLSGGAKDSAPDWHTVPLDGSEPRRVEAGLPGNLDFGRPPPFAPQAWLSPENGVLFAARKGDSIDIWMKRFSLQTGKVVDDPVRITNGAAYAHDVAASRQGRVVYASYEQSVDLWRLPIDMHEGRPNGRIERLTHELSAEMYPVSAPGGSGLLYRSAPSSENAARSQLLFRTGGQDSQGTALLQGRTGAYRPVFVDLDAESAVYAVPIREDRNSRLTSDPDFENVFEVDLSSQEVRMTCERCTTLWAVSPDGRYRLHRGEDNDRKSVAIHDSVSGVQRTILSHPTWNLAAARLSPNGRFVAFQAIVSGGIRRKVFVARLHPDRLTPEDEWAELAPEAEYVGDAEWAPNGELIFYESDEGERMGLRAVRIDPATGRPEGDSWVVYDGTDNGGPPIQSFIVTGLALYRMAVQEDALVFDAVTQHGNLWMLDAVQSE